LGKDVAGRFLQNEINSMDDGQSHPAVGYTLHAAGVRTAVLRRVQAVIESVLLRLRRDESDMNTLCATKPGQIRCRSPHRQRKSRPRPKNSRPSIQAIPPSPVLTAAALSDLLGGTGALRIIALKPIPHLGAALFA
jgi:hypothetical protein